MNKPNQKGLIHTFPLLIVVAAVGVISFLLISSTLPLNGLFGVLNQKPASQAQMMMGATKDDCKINNIASTEMMAFCDQFIMPATGAQRGRGGDLDISRWSFARLTSDINPTQGAFNTFPAVNAQFCRINKTLVADNDSFFCGLEFNEPNHWMEAFNDNGNYVMDSARITQPFDFSGRTGVISFNVDAHTLGEHDIWPEVWITDEPMQAPHLDHPGTHQFPKNGVGFIMNGAPCGSTTFDGKHNALRNISVFKNYVQSDLGTSFNCFTTEPDMANHFEIHISQNIIEFWGSDKDGTNFKKRDTFNVNLPFTRGYLHFQHAQYNAAKDGPTNTGTFHWHGLGFDGPVIPADRTYQVPDSLTKNGTGVNTAYGTPLSYTYNNVNLSNVKQAYLSLNTYFFDNTQAIDYTINGTTHTYTNPAPTGWQWGYVTIPLNLAELKTESNVVKIATTGSCHFSCTPIANIDLDLVLNDNAPFTKFVNPPVPCVTPYPGYTAAPCDGVMPPSTPIPSMTPMPSMGSCPKGPLGDINCDGFINLFDYSTLVSNFGKPGNASQGDLNGDGLVNLFDYSTLVSNFGK